MAGIPDHNRLLPVGAAQKIPCAVKSKHGHYENKQRDRKTGHVGRAGVDEVQQVGEKESDENQKEKSVNEQKKI
jgi:hypothetical protein